jgi:hypothetical protein
MPCHVLRGLSHALDTLASSIARPFKSFLLALVVVLRGLAPLYQPPPFRHDDPPAAVVDVKATQT